MFDLNEFAKTIHEQNKAVGWWNGKQSIYTKLQLISTEIAEATEGERKGLMDDHLTHRKMGEVELADALIRTLDLGWHLGLTYNISFITGSFDYNDGTVGSWHLSLNSCLIDLADSISAKTSFKDQCYSCLVGGILLVGGDLNYNVIEAAVEKLAYNKTRSDHKRENRAKDGGKAF